MCSDSTVQRTLSNKFAQGPPVHDQTRPSTCCGERFQQIAVMARRQGPGTSKHQGQKECVTQLAEEYQQKSKKQKVGLGGVGRCAAGAISIATRVSANNGWHTPRRYACIHRQAPHVPECHSLEPLLGDCR
jgi:hypothetical protein